MRVIYLHDPIGFLLNSTSRNLIYLKEHFLKKYKVTHEQWALIYQLYGQTGMTQKELATRVKKDQPNVTRILDLLEKKNLVRREKKENDRRCFLIFLTEEGQQLYKQIQPNQEVIQLAFQGFTKEEKDIFKTLLSRINQNIEDYFSKLKSDE